MDTPEPIHPFDPAPTAYGQWGPPPANPSPMPGGKPPGGGMRRRTIIALCVGAAVLGAGGFLAIQALGANKKATTTTPSPSPANPARGRGGFGGRGGGTAGTISAIDGSTLTIDGLNGATVKVVTTGSTVVTSRVTGTVGDLTSGDHVTVVGAASGSSVAATVITDQNASTPAGAGRAGGLGGGFFPGAGAPADVVTGTVSGGNGSTVTITKGDGSTVSVSTSPATTIDIVKTIPVAGLATGETVRVIGSTAGDGTVTASTIDEGALGGGRGFGGFVPPPGQG